VFDDAGTAEHVGDPSLERQLFTAVTGKEIGEAEWDHTAERIFNLNRAILLREGRKGRVDDKLPDTQFIERVEPIADVFGMHNPELLLPGAGDEIISRKGKALDRVQFEKMLDEYYELRGWDKQTGLLSRDKLRELDLPEVVEGLAEKVV
jgi:aldehyde:ferredoxin oxidoreductase